MFNWYLWTLSFLALLSSVSFILRSRPHVSGFLPHAVATDVPECLVLTLLVVEEVSFLMVPEKVPVLLLV